MFAPAGARGSARRGLPKSSSYLRVARLVRVEPSRDKILKALEQVIDPELRRPVTELDMVRDVRIDGGDVAVTIALTVAGCPLRSSFEQQVAEALAPVAGVERVSLDFDVMSPDEKAALTAKLRGGVIERSSSSSRTSTGASSTHSSSTCRRAPATSRSHSASSCPARRP